MTSWRVICLEIPSSLSKQAEQDLIVAEHNNWRRRIAKGKEGKGVNGGQPKAANMYDLRWNSELARIAQKWADQCTWEHDTPVWTTSNFACETFILC
jgi:hypothetical protein